MIELIYKLNDEKIRIESSNDDVLMLSSHEDNHFKVVIKARKKITLYSAMIEFRFNFTKENTIFVNGYQSWTDSKEFNLGEYLRDVKKLPNFIKKQFALDKYGDSEFVYYDKGYLNGIDFGYIRGLNHLFIGSINFNNAYAIIKFKLKKQAVSIISDVENKILEEGEEFTLYDFYLDEDIQRGFMSFIKNFTPPQVKKLIGYTSWYNHYQDINETIIYDALKGMDSSKYDLFQIDDGFETYVGDWLDVDPKKFPKGLKPIVEDIHNKGMMAGLWLAPFVAETDSHLFKTRPDFFLKDEKGEFVKAGSNWSGFYSLDLENPEVLAYIKKCLEHYMDMGFDFFKLDFLYASNLGPSKKTHAERSRDAYKFLRQTLKNKLILGCGAIIFNSYSNFDYLRIGPDVSLEFDDVFYMRFMHRERISTKITVQNSIYRNFTDGFLFGNDPDVFLLRDDNIKLSKEQRKSLITINALMGSLLMTSDNISEYDEEKMELLNKSIDIFRNATDKYFEKLNKKQILLRYKLNGEVHTLIYNTEKGVIKDGQN